MDFWKVLKGDPLGRQGVESLRKGVRPPPPPPPPPPKSAPVESIDYNYSLRIDKEKSF